MYRVLFQRKEGDLLYKLNKISLSRAVRNPIRRILKN